MMKYAPSVIILLCLVSMSVRGEADKPPVFDEWRIVDGDTVWVKKIPTVYVFKKKSEKRKYDRLVRNVIKVYPIACRAERQLADMERELLRIPQKWKQREYIRKKEREFVKEYTPVLKKMTFSQGKILIKLIDRQTDKTSYEVVKELRGKFTAAFWQGIARLFDANLKQNYDKEGEDKMIEEIIELYESGKL